MEIEFDPTKEEANRADLAGHPQRLWRAAHVWPCPVGPTAFLRCIYRARGCLAHYQFA